MSYSQNFEEAFILAACPSPTGRFLDIGAWNAFDKSNVRALFEKGWSGVLVEPSPLPYMGLVHEYGAEAERIVVMQAAVVLDPNQVEVELWVTDDAVSTTLEANYEKWKDHVHFQNERVKVAAVTLEWLYTTHGEFDFVSIDAEGTSVDLMHRLFEMEKRPRCVCVEHDERTTEILTVATALGYACPYANAENLVLVLVR